MGNNKKLLIIEDDAHIRRMIEVKFKKHGYQVLMARNGEEGLDLIKTQQPDVVITDINMPKLDGKNLCVQSDELKKERPFLTIVITARIFPDDQKWVNELIDTELIKKPFSPSKMLSRVDQYFGGT